MNDPIECVDCEVEIPLRDVVQRYMRMIEVAPDAKVRAVACPTCLQAIPLSAEQIDTVRSSALRANEAIEGIEDDYRSRHAAMLLLLAHELGLSSDACAEEDVVVRVREVVAEAATAKAQWSALRAISEAWDGIPAEVLRDMAREAAPDAPGDSAPTPERKFGAAAGLVVSEEPDEESPS